MKFFLLFLLFIIPNPTCADVKNTLAAKALLTKAEDKYDIFPKVLVAMAKVESNHDIRAFVKHDGKSRKSSYGLMQIQYDAAYTVGFRGKASDLMKPEVNIDYAAKYFRWLLDKTHDNYAQAICSYNAGYSASVCRKFGNTRYVALVLNAMIQD